MNHILVGFKASLNVESKSDLKLARSDFLQLIRFNISFKFRLGVLKSASNTIWEYPNTK